MYSHCMVDHNLPNTRLLQCHFPLTPELFSVRIGEKTLVCLPSADGLNCQVPDYTKTLRLHSSVLYCADNYQHFCEMEPWERYTYLSCQVQQITRQAITFIFISPCVLFIIVYRQPTSTHNKIKFN